MAAKAATPVQITTIKNQRRVVRFILLILFYSDSSHLCPTLDFFTLSSQLNTWLVALCGIHNSHAPVVMSLGQSVDMDIEEVILIFAVLAYVVVRQYNGTSVLPPMTDADRVSEPHLFWQRENFGIEAVSAVAHESLYQVGS